MILVVTLKETYFFF